MAERGGPGTPGPGGPAVEGLLADQRRRGLRGESLRVEDYIARHPALRDDTEGLLDLIYNEVVLREERGEVPSLPEYRSRFPDLAGPLGDLFEVHGAIGADPTGRATIRAGAGSTSAYPAWPDPGWPALDGYEVVDILGSGGMGIVYRARDLRHGVTVAVKTMRQVAAAAVSRFKQEFRALLDVSHPNLVTLYELISDGRQWFIVMEYVDGVGFLDHVRGTARPAGGDVSPSTWGLEPSTVDFPETAVAPPPAPGVWRAPASPATALAAVGPAGGERLRRALRGLAGGLAALHQAGRLHRDIKPSNVMVTRQGRVVLMDFGLVTTPDRDAGEASTEGQVVGTAAYMAPEQAAGLRASEASDWYSVGVIIYEALTGRLPFSGPPFRC